jgi:hypothetical protein
MYMKKCSKCKVEKSTDEFSNDSSRKDGLNPYCKPCNKKYKNNYYQENREKIDKNSEAYRKTYYKKYFEDNLPNKEKAREANLKRNYGITIACYDKMLEQQNGACDICKTKPNSKLVVDHCHGTNKVRALLCYNCNVALGKFKESLTTLENAIEYIKKHNK